MGVLFLLNNIKNIKLNITMAVLITGANKGIGFEIVKRFAEINYPGGIILTSRNETNGLEAVSQISKEFSNAKIYYYKLDINDKDAGLKTAKFLKENYGPLKILINNAAIAYKVNSTAPISEQAPVTCKTNYFDTKNFTLQMLENGGIQDGGRVLTCGSVVSDMSWNKCSDEIKNKCVEGLKNVEELDEMANDFINLTKNNTPITKYANTGYGMSKIFIRLLTEILAKNNPKINFYSYCPGWCKSDMGGDKAKRTTAQGSTIAFWLGTGNDEIILKNNGKFFRDDDKMLPWGTLYNK